MLVNNIIYYINVFFFIYMFLYAIVFFLTTMISSVNLDDFSIRKRHTSYAALKNDINHIPASILVPAYNEEVTIVDSINSLLHLDYPEYEIIVINDGSNDNTAEVVIDYFNLKQVARPIRKLVKSKDVIEIYENSEGVKIILVNKENGGKSDALNAGINISNFPLFVCVDADSMLQRDSLKKIVEPFLESDETIAVGGNIKVANAVILDNGNVVDVKSPKKWIVLFQMIEYIRVFLNSRVAFNGMNANLIVSGAFGIYKKQAVVNVGGYSHEIIGEDMEIVVKMHAFYRKNNIPYKIAYVSDAICWTQVPEKYSVLKKQRRRWHIGMGQSLKGHRFVNLNSKYGTVGLVAYPYFLLFEYITPILEILGITTIIVSYIFNIINLQFLLLYLLVYMGYNMIVSMIAVLLEKFIFGKNIPNELIGKLLFFCILESFGYRQLISIFRLGAFNPFRKNTWGNMERTKHRELAKDPD